MAEPSGPPTTSTAFEDAVSALQRCSLLPSLVLFKVEGVLWNASEADTEAAPFPDVAGILAALRFKGICVGVSLVQDGSQKMLTKLCAESFEPVVVGDKGDAKAAFKEAKSQSGVPFGEVLYFDDTMSNLQAARSLGIMAHRVGCGMTVADLQQGLQAFHDRQLDHRGF